MENTSLKIIINNIETDINNNLQRIGIHYRLHSRIKTVDSLDEKITSKGDGYYSKEGKKLQDIIGFRITTYFIDDVKLLWDYFSNTYEKVDEIYDPTSVDIFKPLRKNLVCRMIKNENTIFSETQKIDNKLELVDNTFEIQFRTTLSEGWHEVDHSLRYKCKKDWENYIEEDRMLNGIFASLETSDRALKALFDDMSYNHYKHQNWEAMLRMKYRLNFEKSQLDKSIIELFNSNNDLAKRVFRFNRTELLEKIASSGLYMKINFNNIVFLINYLSLKDSRLTEITPSILIDEFNLLS